MKWRTRAEWMWFAPRASWRKTRYWLRKRLISILSVNLACEEFRIGVADSQIGVDPSNFRRARPESGPSEIFVGEMLRCAQHDDARQGQR
jgi:hypothetical protein